MATDGQQVLDSFGKAQRVWDPSGNQDRRQRKMDRIDALPDHLKSVVHDFGWLTVKTMMEAGVTKAPVMRRLIHTILYEHSHEYRSRVQAKAPRSDAADK